MVGDKKRGKLNSNEDEKVWDIIFMANVQMKDELAAFEKSCIMNLLNP